MHFDSEYEASSRLLKAVACVQIRKPQLVALKIAYALHRKGLFNSDVFYCGPVGYYDSQFDIDKYSNHLPVMLKRVISSHQKEFRFAYPATSSDPKPELLDVPELRSFCRIINIGP